MVTLLVGVAVADRIAEWADVLPGSILVLAGAVYVGLDLLHEARHRGGVAHHHHHHHHHDIHEAAAAGMSDNAAIATLVLSLALSPCEAMVPVFVSAAPTGDPVLLLALVVVSGVCTVAVMAVLGTLAFKGVRRLDFGPFAERERLLMGAILAVMGGITLAATLW
jgi:ABC-type nickel/cobalt efflux system permease component RcnA